MNSVQCFQVILFKICIRSAKERAPIVLRCVTFFQDTFYIYLIYFHIVVFNTSLSSYSALLFINLFGVGDRMPYICISNVLLLQQIKLTTSLFWILQSSSLELKIVGFDFLNILYKRLRYTIKISINFNIILLQLY